MSPVVALVSQTCMQCQRRLSLPPKTHVHLIDGHLDGLNPQDVRSSHRIDQRTNRRRIPGELVGYVSVQSVARGDPTTHTVAANRRCPTESARA